MNMNNLMAQAQKMKRDMEKKQQEIFDTDFSGESQLVSVVLSGDKRVKSVKIKNTDISEPEDFEMLEDMIKLAINDALGKIEKEVDDKMGIYGKQLGGLI